MRPIIPLIVAMTFGVIGFSMVFPLLPYMLKLQGVSEFWQVAVFSLFSAVSFFASPLWGRLSDKIGRKRVISGAMFGSMLCLVWLYFSTSAVEIYLNRAFSGLFAGWLAASQAYIGDWVSQKDRVRGMAMMGISFGIGFTIGPSTAILFIGKDWSANSQFFQPSLFYAVICYATAIAIVLLFVKDIPKKIATDEVRLSTRQVLAQPAISQALFMVILFQVVFTAMEGTLALWVIDSFGGGPHHVGTLFGIAGIASIITNGSIVRLGKKFHPISLAIAGMGFLSLSLICLVVSKQEWQAYVIMIFAAIGHGLFVPSCSGFLSRLAPEGWQGGVMGFFQSGNNLSRTAGPMSGGYLYANLQSLAYLALIVPLLPSLILAFRLWKHRL